jgi:hypothetical protein
MAAFATSQHAAVVAITDVAAAALMKKVLLLLVGNWSDSEFLSNRSNSSDAMSTSLYSIFSIVNRKYCRLHRTSAAQVSEVAAISPSTMVAVIVEAGNLRGGWGRRRRRASVKPEC